MPDAPATLDVITIAVVDDQPQFRAGIAMLLQSQSDFSLSWQAGDGAEAVERAEKHPVHVILMDLRMPVMSGVAATQAIVAAADAGGRERPQIIALTTFNRDQAVVEAVQAGAAGYLLKSAEPEFLLASIRTVHAGYSVIAPGSAHDLFQHAARQRPHPTPDLEAISALTAREQDVFLLAAKGLPNAEIARSLFVSEATVKTHLRAVLTKLGLTARLQVVAFAYEHHLLG
ncbi:DNA-binding NarL/FixJ family response regulator [Arthrobacter woluwensis]|uniref:response regulator n=1 Tax=Arthrobacter woluwensis TaxID=156980 RepID=UPI002784EAF9|nr:response regulator transcription factor [Arthrobacter woluwensis]MDQ0707940.1 DNA-binding NarL/FixJ family response regulator [Arthrobacter woluwensis]